MLPTTAEYKEEQKRDLRNASHVFVYLGVISKEAQANAYVDTVLEPYASGDIFQEPVFESYYASLEDKYSRVDGSFNFLPRREELFALFQGVVTVGIGGSITFDFVQYHELDIKGLTIDFGDYYPTEFTVTNGTDTYTYLNDTAGIYVLEDVFNDTDYLTITPVTMVGGQQRMRIHSIIFGVGLTFDNKTLISTQRRTTVDHLSNSLPVKSFTFVINNRGKKFNKDNPRSFINFLQTGQECSYMYGREMDDNSIYKLDGGNVALQTWSSNDSQAKFTCVGYLDFLTSTFHKGQFRPNGITAYALAEEVFADAGIENYRIDTYLKRITLHNPLPLTTHKNCLQMIANATQSVLYEDRSGKVVLESSFTPDIVSIALTNPTDYSENGTIDDEDGAATNYATCENGFSKVDGTLKFLPRTHSSADAVGYVSEALGGANGTIATESSITITWEAQWTFYGLRLAYTPWAMPTQVTVIGYANNEEIVRDTSTNPTYLGTEFDECDKVKVIFDKTANGQRVHCKTIHIGDVSDYEITYHEMADTPIATSMENVKNIDVHYYGFSYGDETNSVATSDISVGDNLITFSTPYYDYTVAWKTGSGTLSIVESGAYYVVVRSSAAGTVEVTAKKIEVSDSTLTYAASEIGTTKTVKNQLIDTKALATTEGAWVADHYNSDTEYTITFRGEPALDSDDLIYLENKFVKENLIRITSETLDTSTGMSTKAHKLTARRVSYKAR